jgi:hypothetical protein
MYHIIWFIYKACRALCSWFISIWGFSPVCQQSWLSCMQCLLLSASLTMMEVAPPFCPYRLNCLPGGRKSRSTPAFKNVNCFKISHMSSVNVTSYTCTWRQVKSILPLNSSLLEYYMYKGCIDWILKQAVYEALWHTTPVIR